MKNFFLTSRNRRRAARVRVSRRLGAEIRQAGRHVRASGGKRRGGLKLIPEIRKLARHPVRQPFKEQRSRELERREKRNSEKQGKKRTERKRKREQKKKSFPRVTRSTKKFFPFRSHVRAHTFPGYTHISLECEQERGDIYACGRDVRYDICERERNGKKGE